MAGKKNVFENLVSQSPNRRSFVKKLGIAGAAVGAVATNRGMAQSSITDFDILNFALNLEYLEAEFYTVVTTGKTLAQLGFTLTGSGTQGMVTGGAMVTLTDSYVAATALELAADEQTHVKLLQTAIAGYGGTAIAEPAINLNALGVGFGSQAEFLTLARAFEDIGVTAYGGAAPLIKNSAILGYAARILAVEAEHSGNIRAAVARLGVPITALDGADHVPPPSGSQYFSTDANALTEIRTPGQVLYVAFGGAANATSGGFFPHGVNGTLNTSSATPAVSDSPSLTANPNPIPLTSSAFLGQTTISWNAPMSSIIQVRVGAPNGTLLTDNVNSGSMMTGPWVTDGMTFYLQDVSQGQANTAANTLATLVVHLKPS
jgi:hypothetical protein